MAESTDIRFRRCAFVAELENGDRLLYELDPRESIHLRLSQHSQIVRSTMEVRLDPPKAMLSGTLLRGVAWRGEFPGQGSLDDDGFIAGELNG